jgi:hypothetical protein
VRAFGPVRVTSVIFQTPCNLPWADADWKTMRIARAAIQAITFKDVFMKPPLPDVGSETMRSQKNQRKTIDKAEAYCRLPKGSSLQDTVWCMPLRNAALFDGNSPYALSGKDVNGNHARWPCLGFCS